ncbi:MAG: DUF3291 domain-containing protein [Pseudomonadota bacterium]
MPIGQFNIARARWPLHDPRMAGFVDNVVRINRLAERTDGFIWRLIEDRGAEAPDFGGDEQMTFTLSVWRDVDSLRHFTWSTLHKQFRLKTAEWFEKPTEAYLAIWPIAQGHRPDGAEAIAMLSELRRTGPTERVFGTETLTPVAA